MKYPPDAYDHNHNRYTRKDISIETFDETEKIGAYWRINDPETDLQMFEYISGLPCDREFQERIGMCYRRGRGVQKDLGKAAEHMKTAADMGNKRAKWKYFDILWEMRKAETDLQMFEYISGLPCDSEYQERIGMCYWRGRGVQKDLGKAAEHMKTAADMGNKRAKCNYYFILYLGNSP